MAPNPVFEFLHKHTLGEVFPLPEGKTVKVLKEGQTVEDAVKLFEAEGIHSAPVVDADGNVLGMLDMLDAVWSIIKVAPTPTAIKEAELRSLEIAGRAMAWEPVEKVIGASGRDPLEPIHENNPVSMALGIFACGVHRSPVSAAKGTEFMGFLSQASLLKYVLPHLKEGQMADMSNLDINELGLGLEDKAGVVSVKQSDTVLKACETLAKASVNAIAVVDDAGALVGNFSASDLKSLYREKLPELTTSVMDFLGAHSKASTEPRAIKANGGTALMDLINATVEQGIRRWWVVNDANEPVGVVSTTDICRVLNSFSYP